MSEPAVRAFIALPLTDAVKRRLRESEDHVRRHTGEGTIRWVGNGAMHLTLKFLGATPASKIEPIGALLKRLAGEAAPLCLLLGPLGLFPDAQRPRVVWAGLTGDVGALSALATAVDRAMAALGFPPEKRRFSPHITLGRVREGAPPFIAADLTRALAEVTGQKRAVAVPVDRLVLFRSTLTPSGAVHDELGSWRLRGRSRSEPHDVAGGIDVDIHRSRAAPQPRHEGDVAAQRGDEPRPRE